MLAVLQQSLYTSVIQLTGRGELSNHVLIEQERECNTEDELAFLSLLLMSVCSIVHVSSSRASVFLNHPMNTRSITPPH